jgi:phosphate/sulfate permease
MREKITSQVMTPAERGKARTDTLIRWQLIGVAAGTAIGLAASLPIGEAITPFFNLTEVTRPLFRLSIASVPAIVGSGFGLGIGATFGGWRSDRLYPIPKRHYPLPPEGIMFFEK